MRCRFPGESCELTAVSYLVNDREGTRIPICRVHRAKVKAHLVAMKQAAQLQYGPMNPIVVEARSMLNAHTRGCQRCGPVEDELTRRMGRLDDAPTEAETVAIGEFITAHACKIGIRLYFRLGAAMKKLDPETVALLDPANTRTDA